ncbi:uncharacterized protein ColSpa_02704 [Colletotrichum spaethianum]|uniref:Uncharacterized protein n=1 Tax=Colletotrichum spaethianum TaxID=700344 RepID=A0AA37L610_9PEZI|nr:uncharacterized protein ColSpa_02704 [Colletotrichum spaethianum]GKT42523.1 hypothetical protein ColSpa_02704 [Colletotrichum spaethianum]
MADSVHLPGYGRAPSAPSIGSFSRHLDTECTLDKRKRSPGSEMGWASYVLALPRHASAQGTRHHHMQPDYLLDEKGREVEGIVETLSRAARHQT